MNSNQTAVFFGSDLKEQKWTQQLNLFPVTTTQKQSQHVVYVKIKPTPDLVCLMFFSPFANL